MCLCSCREDGGSCVWESRKVQVGLGVTACSTLIDASAWPGSPATGKMSECSCGRANGSLVYGQTDVAEEQQSRRKWLGAGHFRGGRGHGNPGTTRVFGNRSVTFAQSACRTKVLIVFRTSFIISSSGTTANHVRLYPTLPTATKWCHLEHSHSRHSFESCPHRPQCLDQVCSKGTDCPRAAKEIQPTIPWLQATSSAALSWPSSFIRADPGTQNEEIPEHDAARRHLHVLVPQQPLHSHLHHSRHPVLHGRFYMDHQL